MQHIDYEKHTSECHQEQDREEDTASMQMLVYLFAVVAVVALSAAIAIWS